MIKHIVITYDTDVLRDPDDESQPMDLYAYLFNELDNQGIAVYMLEFDQAADLVKRFEDDAREAGVTK